MNYWQVAETLKSIVFQIALTKCHYRFNPQGITLKVIIIKMKSFNASE